MDILNGGDGSASDPGAVTKRATIEPKHDEEGAVKYFKYDDNQWVSYDDKTTFKQKVDWANELG
jgi:chitinase